MWTQLVFKQIDSMFLYVLIAYDGNWEIKEKIHT